MLTCTDAAICFKQVQHLAGLLACAVLRIALITAFASIAAVKHHLLYSMCNMSYAIRGIVGVTGMQCILCST